MNLQKAAPTPSPAGSAVELDWYSEDDVVKVCPRNQQRFEIHKDRAIKLLQLAAHAEAQLQFLLTRLAEWIDANQDQLSTAYLTLRGDRFAFVVVSKEPACDDELEDSISDLDFAIANDPDLDLIKMNAMVFPPASSAGLNSFFDDRFKLVYRGRRA